MSRLRYPRRDDYVRLDGKEGKIIQVIRQDEEVLVSWPGVKVTEETHVFDWNGHTCMRVMWRINGILQAINTDFSHVRPVTRALDSYTFDELLGNWVSYDIEDGGYWELAA